MTDRIFFPLFGGDKLAENLAKKLPGTLGRVLTRKFPDGETYLKLLDRVTDKEVIIVAPLENPDSKILPVLFLARTARQYGARKIGLIAPYLPYMRQDARFSPGECLSSEVFADLLARDVDWLITVDPHLHRHQSLSEFFRMPTRVMHSSPLLAEYIKEHVHKPLILYADLPAEKWIKDMARRNGLPAVGFKRLDQNEHNMQISFPDLSAYEGYTPVILEDIIGSGRSITAALQSLKGTRLTQAWVIGVHGLFCGDTYRKIAAFRPAGIVSTDSVPHPTNQIGLADLLVEGMKEMNPVELKLP
ncbi:MAG: ribose-phosphate diphosphokinase [Bacteroidota bacterium]